MKLNRGIFWGSAAAMTTALVAGALMVTVVGIDRPVDADTQIAAEQGEVEAPLADNGDATATNAVEGTEQFRGGGRAGGGGHAGGGHAVGGHAAGHTAWGHGGYGHAGWGHGYGGRGWGGGSRWGHWGGGRYVNGRWAAGPYWGWCDGRYYSCARSWY